MHNLTAYLPLTVTARCRLMQSAPAVITDDFISPSTAARATFHEASPATDYGLWHGKQQHVGRTAAL